MKKITIYHNPRCSKSREALSLLQEKQCELTIVEYLKTPLSFAEIKSLLQQLHCKPIEMMRIKEDCFDEMGLSATSTDAALINAMAKNPILIERPIVSNGKSAVIARPLEKILTIL